MAENSNIEWTDHTFNPWIGCTAISSACDNCYAEVWDARFKPEGNRRWGPHAPRTRTSSRNWNAPLRWDRDAEEAAEKAAARGEAFQRPRVFCASLADVFDNHRSIQQEWRDDLWALIEATPHLDWLLLTKRPQNIEKFAPWRWGQWPDNVWIGTTVENQDEADRRIWSLIQNPAKVRFLSCEPLLGPVDLTRVKYPHGTSYDALRGYIPEEGVFVLQLDWIIAGGESGANARPMHPDWVRGLRDQCAEAKVPFHFKQWGEFEADEIGPEDARSGDYPPGHVIFNRVGKKAAGRKLGGRTWDETPTHLSTSEAELLGDEK